MIAEVAAEDRLPADIVLEIAERTDGVPLFIEEVTKAALEAGAQASRDTVIRAAPEACRAGDAARLPHCTA